MEVTGEADAGSVEEDDARLWTIKSDDEERQYIVDVYAELRLVKRRRENESA